MMERPDPPPRLQELARERGYWIQYDIQKGEWAWWLTLGRHPETLEPQLEKCGMRPYSPFTPDYLPNVLVDHRGEYTYHPHYPPLYHGMAARTLGIEVEEDVEQNRELFKKALSHYTDGSPNWRVQRECLSDLTAERDDLQQQIEREGERIETLLRTAMSILEVLYSEYRQAIPEQEEPSADDPPSRLVIDLMSMRTRFFQGSRASVREKYEAVSERLREAGVADFLISRQWYGIEDLLDARDVVLEPVFYMDKKRVICEKLLNAARLDKRAPRWREMKKHLRQGDGRDSRTFDRRWDRRRRRLTLAVLARKNDGSFVMHPRWTGELAIDLFEELAREDEHVGGYTPAENLQGTFRNKLGDRYPGGGPVSKWVPLAKEWAGLCRDERFSVL